MPRSWKWSGHSGNLLTWHRQFHRKAITANFGDVYNNYQWYSSESALWNTCTTTIVINYHLFSLLSEGR